MLEQRQTKPNIVVSDIDHRRLTRLATAGLDRNPEVAEELLSELERAETRAASLVPSNIVQMGSQVAFRSDDGQQRRITLVFPNEADITDGKVSIMTPIGTALIGLSPGQTIAWIARDGRQHELTVLAVEPAGAPA